MAARKRYTLKAAGLFALTLSQCGKVGEACEAVGISRMTAYRWRAQYPDFADLWAEAINVFLSVLEDDLIDRAKTSDLLLMFKIKQLDPSYRENHRAEQVSIDANAKFAELLSAIQNPRQADRAD